MSIRQPLIFSSVSYDSKTANLVLINNNRMIRGFADGPVDRAGVQHLLGDELSSLLFASPGPADSGWEFHLEGDWQLWRTYQIGELVSRLDGSDGETGDYVVHAYNDVNHLYVDVRKRGIHRGDRPVLTAAVNSDVTGLPSLVIHDAKGSVAVTVELADNGQCKVALRGDFVDCAISDLRSALIASRPYVVGACECAFPDEHEKSLLLKNKAILANIDAVLASSAPAQ